MKVSENEMRLIEEKEKLKAQIYILEKSISNYYIERVVPWVYTFFVLLFGFIVIYVGKEYVDSEFIFMSIINYAICTWLLYFIQYERLTSFLDKIIKFGISKSQYKLEKEKLNKLYSELYPIRDNLNNINRSRKEYNYYLSLKDQVDSWIALRYLNILLENLENNRYSFNYKNIHIFRVDVNNFELKWKYEKNNLNNVGSNVQKKITLDNLPPGENNFKKNNAIGIKTTTNKSKSFGSEKINQRSDNTSDKILSLPIIKPDIPQSQKFDTVYHLKNIKIGELGELFVIEQEKKRLISAGRSDLAQMITHISKENGDSAGYDVLSYDINGIEKKIEVKTTVGNVSDDFFLTENEYQCMNNNDNYYIYRVFNYSKEENTGQIKEIHCVSDMNQLNINISSYFVKPNILKSN
jgi:Domain of unknown function (DUF3883)